MAKTSEELSAIAAQITLLTNDLSPDELYVAVSMAFRNHDWNVTDRMADAFIALTVGKQRETAGRVFPVTRGGNTL